MNEKICKGEHSGHLCVLASKNEFEKIKDLVKNPGFICFNCGRAADWPASDGPRLGRASTSAACLRAGREDRAAATGGLLRSAG